MRRRRAISPGFFGHYQDLRIQDQKGLILPAVLFLALTVAALLTSRVVSEGGEVIKLHMYGSPARYPKLIFKDYVNAKN